ncbi:MAG: nucleotidyltransferase family protein [Candidatus Heimdallarchaeota archaeon]|nr:nucleotidyltransferase family protein [Candidatus Heimdallarchaeota archaeon]
MKITEAIILAGGKGTRLRSVTEDRIPKGMVKIKNKPIVEWEINWLAREGVNKVIISTGHLGEKFEEYFGDHLNTPFGQVKIGYNMEKTKLGSGGAFKESSLLLESDRCFVLNGDILCNSSLDKLIMNHFKQKAYASMLLVKLPSPFGVVEVSDNIITKFVEKPLLPVYIHAGLDIIERNIFDKFPDKGQMEETIFIELAEQRKFAAMKDDNCYWRSIDTQKDFDLSNENWIGL